jgi:hypothetical protein
MGLCSDESNQYLRDVGYNVVRLPRNFLPPLSLLAKQRGTVEYIGEISSLIDHPAGNLPAIKTNQTTSNINGKTTSGLDLSLGLSILNGLIAGLGGGKLGVSTSYTNARTVTFEFNNVQSDSVDALQVGNFLRDGRIDAGNPLIEQYVLGNGSLYVVTERLKASEITASFEGSKGVKANVDVPVIANQVGATIAVALSNGRSNAVKFQGKELLTFGFKCFEIGVVEGKITMLAVKPGALVASVNVLDEDADAKGVLLGSGLLDVVKS